MVLFFAMIEILLQIKHRVNDLSKITEYSFTRDNFNKLVNMLVTKLVC